MFFMMDLETLGTVPGCAMLSIGIININPRAEKLEHLFTDNGLYVVVSQASCEQAFLSKSQDTIDWWSRQSGGARQVLDDSKDDSKSVCLLDALEQTINYVGGHCTPHTARVLGNGSDFDNAIMSSAADAVGLKLPWSYGGRCYRTLKNLDEFLGPQFAAPKITRSGTYHNALDDARNQAVHLWQTLHMIKRSVGLVEPAPVLPEENICSSAPSQG